MYPGSVLAPLHLFLLHVSTIIVVVSIPVCVCVWCAPNLVKPTIDTEYSSYLEIKLLVLAPALLHVRTSSFGFFPALLCYFPQTGPFHSFLWFDAGLRDHFLQSLHAIVNVSGLGTMRFRGQREVAVFADPVAVLLPQTLPYFKWQPTG